jgi:hypothetical protein
MSDQDIWLSAGLDGESWELVEKLNAALQGVEFAFSSKDAFVEVVHGDARPAIIQRAGVVAKAMGMPHKDVIKQVAFWYSGLTPVAMRSHALTQRLNAGDLALAYNYLAIGTAVNPSAVFSGNDGQISINALVALLTAAMPVVKAHARPQEAA